MSEEWTLRWEIYPKREHLEVNPGMSTLFCFCDDGEAIKTAMSRIERWLKKSHYEVEAFWPDAYLDEYTVQVKKATKVAEKIIVVPAWCDDAIIIRISESDIYDKLKGPIYKDFGNDIVWVASVNHTKTSFALEGFEGKGTMLVGTLDRPEENQLHLYKFYEFRVGRKLAAKALVNYVNGEMAETGPTIEMLEVRKSWQGKGIARKLLKKIEEDAKYEGFIKIWSSDDRLAMDFWEHMGYEMDLDEGYKWLIE